VASERVTDGRGGDGPDGVAEAVAFFSRFPVPLALVDASGTLLLANAAYSTRFDGAVPDPESIGAVPPGGDGQGLATLVLRAGSGPVRARVRALRLANRVLLVFPGPEDDGAPPGELHRLRDRVSELEQLAATDHLTGAWNRAHFERVIEAELARSAAVRQPVSLALLDIDHFKRINDSFGHGVGDEVLRELVRLVGSRVRPSDVLFRWGGEEFAVLLAAAGYRGAERAAENLRAAVAAHAFGKAGRVTVSVGVAEHDGGEDRERWFGRLDEALYAAKRGGRDRVVVDRRGDSDAWAAEGGAAPLSLAWQEAYECGEPTIDAEHRELFAMANRLIEASSRAQSEPGVFLSMLDLLVVHVRRHFADEEAILGRLGYAELEPHRRAHEGLLRRAGWLRERAQAGEATLGAVVEFLAQDVVARHLLTVDRAFFPLFGKGPAGSRKGAATAPPQGAKA